MDLETETKAEVWREVFAKKAQKTPLFPWDEDYSLSTVEYKNISPSIQIFQIGENAEGRSFIRAAKEYAEKTGDQAYVEALRLFIREEQTHSALLAAVMRKFNIPLIEKHWSDEAFRWSRKLLGLELCIMILVTAELIAKSYYRALRDASDSRLLKAVCNQILKDEVYHIWFQGNTLRKLRQGRSRPAHCAVESFQFIGMLLACLLVWKDHRGVFKAGGYTLSSFTHNSLKLLKSMNNAARMPIQNTEDFSRTLVEQIDIRTEQTRPKPYSMPNRISKQVN